MSNVADVTNSDNTSTDAATEVAPSSYSTESTAPAAEAAPRAILSVSGAAVGRRKQAIARVRIAPGAGTYVVNGRTLEEYFPNKLHQQLINDPSGQAGALRLAIARALNEIDRENNRATLKKAGFLTRDARVIERKKAGLKKARKAPQYSKR